MTTFKKISFLIFALCVFQWFVCTVESAVTAEAGKNKAAYGNSDDYSLSSMFPYAGLLDSIYRKSRQSRCVTCYEDRRYGDNRSRYYSGYAARSGDDHARSGHYQSYDRYDDRGYRGAEYDKYASPVADRYESDRYGADRYGANRYGADRYGNADRYAGYRDDPYGARPFYDRYDSLTRGAYDRAAAYDRGESRGYAYENRDRYYAGDRGLSDFYGRDRYYERPRYAATSGAGSAAGYGSYDRDYYDRYSTRYDSRHYRPWDDTYRPQPGYDGRGGYGYYAKRPEEDRRYLPESAYKSREGTPCGIRKPNCPYDPQEEGTRVTSDTIDSGHYNLGVSHTTYNTNSNTDRNESSKGSRSGSGSPSSWSYVREDEQASKGGSNSHSERQSSGYGALLDRSSNLIAVEPTNSNSTNSMTSSDLQNDTKSSDATTKQSDKENNS